MEITNTRIHIREMVYVALFAALNTICAWISIPTIVPFTLQTFAICVTGGLLGAKLGTLSLLVYILLGAMGLPVFAGFSSGFGALLGTTGGYLLGFLFIALVVGLFTDHFGKKVPAMAVSMVIGIGLCYLFGTVWYLLLYTSANGPVAFMTVLGWCVFPFVIPDLCKAALAIVLIKRLEKVIHI